jgi:hypothetical protein
MREDDLAGNPSGFEVSSGHAGSGSLEAERILVKPTTPIIDMATRAVRQGVVTSRFSITREQAAELKKIEAHGGQPAGLQYVLKLLAAKRTNG